MSKTLFPGTIVLSLAFVGVFLFAAQAFATSGYGGDPVACTMIATPDTIGVGGGTTLTWTLSDNVVSAVLSGKNSSSWMQNVPLNGSWYVSGILDTREYTLTVTGPEGQTATCDAGVTVNEPVVTPPFCEIEAVPSTIGAGEGTTLTWDSSDNVVSAVLHPTGSMSWTQSVPMDGSWYIGGITDSRSYSLTVSNSNGDEYTCDAPITVVEDTDPGTAPTCTMEAIPDDIPVGGGTTLVWTGSDNVVSAKLHPAGSTSYFADVTPDGSWYISGITNSRGYSVTVETVGGQTATCTADITTF
jgi:hypothetical protein